MTLYNCLVTPYLTYAPVVWGGTYHCHLDKIVRIQKSALRSANNLSCNSHTSPCFKTHNLMKLPDLYRYSISVMMYKAFSYNDSIYLFNNLPTHSDIHLYSTRYRVNLVIPRYRKSKTRMSISQFWNALPASTTNCNSFSMFKSVIKNFFIQ